MKQADTDVLRFYRSFMEWYMAFYPNEAFNSQIGGVTDKDGFVGRIREWAKEITTND